MGWGKQLKGWAKDLIGDFLQVSGQLDDPEHDEALAYLTKVSRELFMTQGASGANGRWPAAKRPRNPLMRRTQRLFRSLTVAGHSEQVFEVSAKTIEFGTIVPYAQYHQDGRGVPMRKVVDLTPAQVDKLFGIIVDKTFAPIFKGN